MHPLLIFIVVAILMISVLPLLGFGSGGIIFGSFAAYWQSIIGNVVGGSFFSVLQSLGAGYVGRKFVEILGALIAIRKYCVFI